MRAQPVSAEDQFAASIEARLQELSKPRSFVIPVLQTDPPVTDPTNLWMRADGRLRGRYWTGTVWTYVDYPLRSDITSPPAVPAAPAVPAKPPAPKTYVSKFTATWSQTYQGDGDKRTDDRGENFLVYGNSQSDSFNGTQRALIGFGSMTGALASSTIKRVQLKMTNVHAYWNSGVDIYFGVHNESSEPADWASASVPVHRARKQHFGKPQTRTVDLPVDFGQRFRAGSAKGIAIEAPSSDRAYYGYAGGVGSGYTTPQLIITYAK